MDINDDRIQSSGDFEKFRTVDSMEPIDTDGSDNNGIGDNNSRKGDDERQEEEEEDCIDDYDDDDLMGDDDDYDEQGYRENADNEGDYYSIDENHCYERRRHNSDKDKEDNGLDHKDKVRPDDKDHLQNDGEKKTNETDQQPESEVNVGSEFVREITVFYCELCNRYCTARCTLPDYIEKHCAELEHIEAYKTNKLKKELMETEGKEKSQPTNNGNKISAHHQQTNCKIDMLLDSSINDKQKQRPKNEPEWKKELRLKDWKDDELQKQQHQKQQDDNLIINIDESDDIGIGERDDKESDKNFKPRSPRSVPESTTNIVHMWDSVNSDLKDILRAVRKDVLVGDSGDDTTCSDSLLFNERYSPS